MIKRIIFILLGVFLILLLITQAFNFFFLRGKPNFQDDIVSSVRKNDSLKTIIGEYKNHAFSYPTNELEMDSLHFELVIFATKRTLIYNGCAVKNENKWIVKRKHCKIE